MTCKYLANRVINQKAYLYFILSLIVVVTFTFNNDAFAIVYHYSPFFTTTGTNRVDVADRADLRLSSFTVATWFKTTGGWSDEGIMVNKGGLGSESAGANQNYGLWFTSSDQLQAGFEVTGGSNRYITPSTNYLDNQWHHAVVTFDNPTNIIRLFVDGLQVGTLSTTSNPDNTGTQPLRIGENSQSPLGPDAFIGQLDEVGVWNRALTIAEVTHVMNLRADQFPANGLVYSNSFGTSTPEVCNDNIDNDGDTLIDIQDPDCQTPEVCNDNIDNDGDTLIDAADPDCQTSETCTNLPISAVQANGFQSGNPPQNAIDNNLNTRWSQEGIGSWIQLDLGIEKLICSVDIAWYSGNQRQNNFVISVSSDGTTFNNIFTGTSSGTTLSPEKYDIVDVNARYVKITVNGNTQNQWASITEIDVYGPDPSQPPPPLNFKFAYKFGTKGNGNGQFQDPHDVSFDSSGNVFVPDRVRNDIQKFTHEGMFLSKFGGPGSGPGQFNVPYSIAHDSNNNIYVSDRENNRIQKLTNDGVFITELKSINGKNFVMPEDLAFDFTNGDLYITDTGNNRIVKLDKNLNFILQWGSKGTGDGQFDHPHAIDVGPDRNVYVSSGFQPYIQKFDPNGNFIKKWGKEGSGDGEMLMFLEHLDVDSEGRVFLINNNIRPVVQVWDSEGNYLTKFGSEKEGSADGQLAEPEHVTVDNDGKPFIVDSGNFRIQVFTPEVVSSSSEESGLVTAEYDDSLIPLKDLMINSDPTI
ncbi:MAG TPA: LamG-like jellyroll fold domain-containing protein, partial [Nitrososphaeraceae archaeon]|nr:LamG-like jellyroll fold domain-containing protein [Nitrososphaeraceae archaeon]